MDGRRIFREELAIKYPDHGHALWEPNPGGLYEAVEVGDVGFIDRGYFNRLFNALRPPPSNSDASNGPKYPPRLEPKNPNHIRKDKDNHQDFCSHSVQGQLQELYAVGPEDVPITVICSERQGAFLHLPFLADREETTARRDFAKWILKHVDNCLKVADDLGCDVNRMEDIILVTGRHLARSWVSVAFSARRKTARVSFRTRVSGPSGVHFVKLDESGGELKLGPTGEDLPENQCVFVQGYRVAHILNFWPRLRAAGSVPDLHDPEPESDMRLEAIGIPSEADDYPDPLRILLNYIAEQASNCDMILVHDNDLGFMDGALRSDTLIQHIRSHAPPIRQVRCELHNEHGSEAAAEITTVATLSQDLFESLHEDQTRNTSLGASNLLRFTASSPMDDDSSNVVTMPVPAVQQLGPLTQSQSQPPPQHQRYPVDKDIIFRKGLAIGYPENGYALWEPDPGGIYEAVEVGDVGFIRYGYFCRMFNALKLPPSDSDASGGPKYPPRLNPRISNHILHRKDYRQDFFSRNVRKQQLRASETFGQIKPDDVPITIECSGGPGAFLHLPFQATCEETVARVDFGKWIVKHVDDCLKVTNDLGYDLNRMEDIVLVTGRHLARSWVSIAFPERSGIAHVSFQTRMFGPSDVHFVATDVSGLGGAHLKLGPMGKNLPENQCVFIRGFCVSRNFWRKPRLRDVGSVPDQSPRSIIPSFLSSLTNRSAPP